MMEGFLGQAAYPSSRDACSRAAERRPVAWSVAQCPNRARWPLPRHRVCRWPPTDRSEWMRSTRCQHCWCPEYQPHCPGWSHRCLRHDCSRCCCCLHHRYCCCCCGCYVTPDFASRCAAAAECSGQTFSSWPESQRHSCWRCCRFVHTESKTFIGGELGLLPLSLQSRVVVQKSFVSSRRKHTYTHKPRTRCLLWTTECNGTGAEFFSCPKRDRASSCECCISENVFYERIVVWF